MGMIKKFHNLPKDVRKSVADQTKLLSWISGAVNGYFVHTSGGGVGSGMFIVMWWLIFQLLAHFIIYTIGNEERE